MNEIERNLRLEAALDSTYGRAVGIVQNGGVISYDVEDDGEYVTLYGSVKGSGSRKYTVDATYRRRDKSFMDYGCECDASWNYSGMCKHEIALVLAYLIDEGEMASPRAYGASGTDAGGAYVAKAGGKAGRGALDAATLAEAKRIKRTSGSVEALLRVHAYDAQNEASVWPEKFAGTAPAEVPAELTCILSEGIDSRMSTYYGGGGGKYWSLGLKISRGKASYIVKNIPELVSAWRTNAYYTYGKNLAFVHGRSAFSSHANELLDALAPVVEAQHSMYGAMLQKYAYDSLNYSSKSIPLDEGALAKVLELLVGCKAIVETEQYDRYYSKSKQKNTVTVADGNPQFSVNIERRDGGYLLSIEPSDLRFVRGKGALFAIGGDSILKTSAGFASRMGRICRVLLPSDGDFEIRDEDMPGFCAAALPALREFTSLTAPEGLEAHIPPAPEFTFRIGEEDGDIVCRSTVEYGEVALDLFEPASKDQPLRDIAAEIRAQTLVAGYFPYGELEQPDYKDNVSDDPYRYDPWGYVPAKAKHVQAAPYIPHDDDEAYYRLFADGLRELAEVGEVLVSERLRSVTVRRAPSVRVSAGVKNGLLDIELHADDMTPAELVAYLASFERKQRFVRLSNGDIVRLDGSVQALAELGGGLGLAPKELVEGVSGLPLNRTLFVDAICKRAGGIRFERNRAFKSIIRDFDTIADQDLSVPDGIEGTLRSYQDEGYKWLSTLGKVGFGGVLADDMGLGKTLQMIAYFLARKDEGETRPAIVVCPASLVYNWVAEMERFAPGLDAVPVVGTKAARRGIVGAAEDRDVVVTSYDLLKRDIDEYEGHEFSCAVLDEAQYIKNSNTQSAKSVKRLNAANRFALTGTPIENRLGELWSIFDFLMPGVLGTEGSFEKRFAKPIADHDESASRQLQSLVGPFILRRLKKDVLTDLPDKNESVVYASMDGEQEKLYRANELRIAHLLSENKPEEFAGMKLQILAELTRLRQICCDPHLLYEDYKGDSAKLETCLDVVRTACEGGHGVLLFSQFTSMLDVIEARLAKEKIRSFKLTGATSKEERTRLVARFQAGEAPVFLISLKAGGVGLNLTAADIVIHYDPWWNVAAQNQATDRAHRIGQTKDVSVFKLIAKGTIEERIVEMQERKRDLAESVLGGEAVESTGITREDLLALLNA